MKIVIIGAGPAGLTCAYEIFEIFPKKRYIGLINIFGET